MEQIIISVITVCLNPGKKLAYTLDSILKQSYPYLEVVVKDGGSTDGSIEKWREENKLRPEAEKVKIFTEKDTGIYDAMNQAASYAEGNFFVFLNCGDAFADEKVLERVAAYEGGGFSENQKNREADRKEHRQITETYMGKSELFRYRFMMFCTLAPLHSMLAESRLFSGVYHWVKGKVYQ